jgi:hypothetical protein
VDEHQARVDEIETRRRQFVAHDVVPLNAQVCQRGRRDVPRIEVGTQHGSGGRDALRHPVRDGAAAAAELETVPAVANTDGRECALRAGVEQVGEHAHAACGLGLRIVE